jgi:plastocyanin
LTANPFGLDASGTNTTVPVYISRKQDREEAHPMHRITAITTAVLTALALVFTGGGPAEAGGGCHSDVFSDEANTQVELTKNCFEPTVVRVAPGDTVTWTNSDPDPHTVTGVARTWGSDQNVNAGASVSYQFDETGVFPYFCAFHPSMVGAVVVGDGTAASARAAKDGVKAVSAEVSGGQASRDEPAEVLEEDTGSGVSTVPIVIGVGVLAAMGGFAGALVLRRKSGDAE